MKNLAHLQRSRTRWSRKVHSNQSFRTCASLAPQHGKRPAHRPGFWMQSVGMHSRSHLKFWRMWLSCSAWDHWEAPSLPTHNFYNYDYCCITQKKERKEMKMYFTLNDFCRMPMGKSLMGLVVIHKRKLGLGFVIPSNAFSRSFSHFTNRWQFCSINHWPQKTAFSRCSRATFKIVTGYNYQNL